MNKHKISELQTIESNDIPTNFSQTDIFISAKGLERTVGLNSIFQSNKKGCSSYIEIDDTDFIQDIDLVFKDKIDGDNSINICIDISLVSRKDLAKIISFFINKSEIITIKLSILYSLAEYAPPSEEFFPNERVESVGALFSGWCSRPGLPVKAIVGLGYEKNKALGAIEYLECSNSLLLLPNSSEMKYKDDILSTNSTLLSFTSDDEKVDYDVQSPTDTIYLLDSLISGYKTDAKLVLLPFGPKIFYACALIVAVANPEVSVWHVSSVDKQNSLMQDRKIIDSFGFSCNLRTMNPQGAR